MGCTPSVSGSTVVPVQSVVDFYLNKVPSQPDGEFLDVYHVQWAQNYDKLERHHGKPPIFAC